jgi:hypothetical protein
MEQTASTAVVREIMHDFADSTGLSSKRYPPRRYLWTDAFAICNLLGLFHETGEEIWRGLALRLVDQVHHTLGRHRDDDQRMGWISGLDANEGEEHPTTGGLRIGKKLNERKRWEPYNESLEWERDGQYYHYLTKWIHALNQVSLATKDPAYLRWALELAKTAHSRFSYIHPGSGGKRLYWKMSIDLGYPLVLAMGRQDPLDGMVTYSELQATAKSVFRETTLPDLEAEIHEMEQTCREEEWSTNDPLGIGGLLFDAWRIVQLTARGPFSEPGILKKVLDAAIAGLESFAGDNPLKYRARQRLPFRELGLAIGLRGIERIRDCVSKDRDLFGPEETILRRLDLLAGYAPMGRLIERFWMDGKNREEGNWVEHGDINTVMLATSLAPDSFLSV